MKKIFNLLRNLPVGVKASAGFLLANILTKGIAYITTPIYTRLLSSEQYGQTSVFLTWLQVFGIVAMFCLSAGVFNNGMVDFPDNRDEYSFSMLILSNLITILFAIVLFITYPLIKDYLDLDIPLLILMCIVFIFQPAYNFWTSRQRYELKYKLVFFWSVCAAVISPVVAIICILNSNDRLYGRLFGAEIALVIIYTFFYFYIAYKAKFKVDFRYWKYAIKFNLPLIPHYLSTYLLSSADTLMISHLVGKAEAGYYSIAYSVAIVVTIIWSAVNGSLVPFTYENCKKENYSVIGKVTLPILIFFATCCLGIIMLAPELVYFMTTEEYMDAIYVIPPIVGGIFFQVQYYIYANIVYYYKKSIYIMYGSVIAVILNLILNYVFITKFGYYAAGYTTLFCYIVQAVIDYIAMKHIVKAKVYDMKVILLLSGIVILIALLSNYIYDLPVVRYSIICLVVVGVFMFRKKILAVFAELKNL